MFVVLYVAIHFGPPKVFANAQKMYVISTEIGAGQILPCIVILCLQQFFCDIPLPRYNHFNRNVTSTFTLYAVT